MALGIGVELAIFPPALPLAMGASAREMMGPKTGRLK
jgi:hypothetical protein